jgi:hypothetical protein
MLCHGVCLLLVVRHLVVRPQQHHLQESFDFVSFCSSLQCFAFGDMAFNFTDVPEGIDLRESRTASNNAIGIVLFVLSLLFVALRLVVRLRMKHEPLGLDDYLMFLGLALNAGNLACCIAGGFYGLGKHIWSLDVYQMRQITIVRTVFAFADHADIRRSRSRMFSYMPGVCASSSSQSSLCIDESSDYHGLDTAAWASPRAIC